MSMLAPLIAAAALLQGEPGPVDLVRLLGSADRAERDEAARTLEELGSDALPALAAGGPEVLRARAAAVEATIRGRLLLQPTLVAVNFVGEPLADVLRTLGERGGHPLILDPGLDPAVGRRPIRVAAAGPIPFWEALDLVGRAAGVRHDPSPTPGAAVGRGAIRLVSGDPPAGTAYRGPFRLHLVGIQRRRDVDLGSSPGHEPATLGVLYAEIQAFVEPGRRIDFDGPPRIEAIDDRGRSLSPSPPNADWPRQPVNYWRRPGEPELIQWRIPLGLPDRAVFRLRRLKGSLPLLVSTPKPDPLILSLDSNPTQSRHHDGATIECRVLQDIVQRFEVEIRMKPDRTQAGAVINRHSEFFPARFSFEDARKNPLAAYPLHQQDDPDGVSVLRIMVADGPRPIRLCYHGLILRKVVIPFEFTDVALP